MVATGIQPMEDTKHGTFTLFSNSPSVRVGMSNGTGQPKGGTNWRGGFLKRKIRGGERHRTVCNSMFLTNLKIKYRFVIMAG